jgi:hypothetical protein
MKKKFLQQVINHLNEQIKSKQCDNGLCDLFFMPDLMHNNTATKLESINNYRMLKGRLNKEFPEMNGKFNMPYFPWDVQGHLARIKFVEKWVSELEQQEGGSVA